MKKLSFSFLCFASKKLILRYLDLSNSDKISNVPEFQNAFILGVRFREELSKSSVKAKEKFCSDDFPISDIYSNDTEFI